jgi:hypothetical protein
LAFHHSLFSIWVQSIRIALLCGGQLLPQSGFTADTAAQFDDPCQTVDLCASTSESLAERALPGCPAVPHRGLGPNHGTLPHSRPFRQRL